MSERASQLATKTSDQVMDMIDLLADLSESDLRAPCSDNTGETTVGESAAHVAMGYGELTKFLESQLSAPREPSRGFSLGSAFKKLHEHVAGGHDDHGDDHGHDHGHDHAHGHGHGHGHGDDHDPTDVKATAALLSANGVAASRLLETLSDEQLDAVMPRGSVRFADGKRSLYTILDTVVEHQGSHLTSMTKAVDAVR
jgi:hypothetical protein